MRVLLCSLLCLALDAGCSKSQPKPTDGPASGDVARTDAPVEGAAASAYATSERAAMPAPSLEALAGARSRLASDDCEKFCAPIRKLACRRASECVDSCRQMIAVATCRPDLMRFFTCAASEPTEHWECVDDGTGAIKEGFCEREQAAFAACLEKSDVH